MVETLNILAEELRRLRALGVKRVPVSEEAIQALREAMAKLAPEAPATPVAEVAPVSEPAAARPPAGAARRVAPVKAEPTLPFPPVVRLPEGGKEERMKALRDLVLADETCQKQLRPGCQLVVGTGTLDAKVFFCGEAPGAEEEQQGLPFVGPAGQKLAQMITAMGLSRETVYIGNIMNWRPQIPSAGGGPQEGNRPPTTEELAYCLPYLQAQLDIVKPDVIVALGATAAKGLLGEKSFNTLQEVRSRWQTYKDWPVMVTYHPSYVLRKESEGKISANKAKRAVWEDLMMVMERVNLPISDKHRRYFL